MVITIIIIFIIIINAMHQRCIQTVSFVLFKKNRCILHDSKDQNTSKRRPTLLGCMSNIEIMWKMAYRYIRCSELHFKLFFFFSTHGPCEPLRPVMTLLHSPLCAVSCTTSDYYKLQLELKSSYSCGTNIIQIWHQHEQETNKQPFHTLLQPFLNVPTSPWHHFLDDSRWQVD